MGVNVTIYIQTFAIVISLKLTYRSKFPLSRTRGFDSHPPYILFVKFYLLADSAKNSEMILLQVDSVSRRNHVELKADSIYIDFL